METNIQKPESQPSLLPAQPTIIVVHHRERRSKCTVEPLRTQAGFEFWSYPLKPPHSPKLIQTRYVRLGLGGPLISPADREFGLLVLDGTWRWAEKMEADFDEVPVRSLPAWQTAYPRVSKVFDDPSQGLATIEAIFAAYHHMGYDTTGLLEAYHWKDPFLKLNTPLLETSAL